MRTCIVRRAPATLLVVLTTGVTTLSAIKVVVPRTVLIGKDGQVVYTAAGSKEFEGIVKLQEAIARELKR